jgi:signal transduction histidine kinase
VFEPFFTTKGSRGTGLGLPVVRDLVRGLGGDLTIVSVPVIAGTCVRVGLPRAATRVP